jgi:hypothetical protein
MNNRFFIGKGRYTTVKTSRYQHFTYGQNSFSRPEEDVPEDEAHGTYGASLFDKRWKEKRLGILERDNRACVICKSTEKLQVHHRQYHFIKDLQQFKAPWDYDDDLLVTLCERCHAKGHGKYKVPNVYL